MASEHSGPGIGTGLVLGAIIGGLAGLLLAPRPGEETRAQVKERTAGLRERAGDLAVEARESLKGAIEEGRVVASRIRTSMEGSVPPGEPSSDNREEPVS